MVSLQSRFTLDELKCPLCLEIPEAEVYQCKNGHALCSNCYSKVEECPHCQVPLGSDKIKNLLFESTLDKTLLPCKYKEFGCTKMKIRREKPAHEKFCLYEWRLLGVCDRLGYKCDFKTKLLKQSEILAHFQQAHSIPVESKSYVTINLKNFNQIDGLKSISWTPFILQLGKNLDSSFIFQVQVKKRDKALRMGCQFLKDPLKDISTNYNVSFSIKSSFSKVVDIDWTIYPRVFNFSGRTVRLLNYTIFTLPINFLKLYYMEEGSLTLTVKVTTSSEIMENRKSLCDGIKPLCLLPKEKFTDYWGYDSWSCHQCKSKIIEHLWYWCLQCSCFILCRACMALRKHSHHVFAMLKGVPQQEYLIMLATNNKGKWITTLASNQAQIEDSPDDKEAFLIEYIFCRCLPIIGVLYRCLLCPKNVDICQSCVDKDEHRCHILGVILNPMQAKFWKSQKKHGSPMMPLLASKVNLS